MIRTLLIALLALPSVVFSQTVITVFTFDEPREPLWGAHVHATAKDGTNKVFVTDEQGSATVPSNFSNGPFAVEVSFVGYAPLNDTLMPGEQRTIHLNASGVSLNQFVITAQYAPSSPDKAVNRVKIIDRKRIEAQGAVNLRDVLTNETNIRISQDNILGSGMSMQGVSGQNVKILIDGVPMIGRLDGNIDLSQINMNNVERIEIVEGPLSVEYGTNALAGTINIIIKKDQKGTWDAGVKTFWESAGQYNADFRTGVKWKQLQFNINGGRYFFDGWSPGDAFVHFPATSPADTNRTDQWNPKEQYFTDQQLIWRHNEMTLRVYNSLYHEYIENWGMPRSPYFETAFDDEYRTFRADQGFDLQFKPATHWNAQILASHNYFKRNKNTWFRDLTTLDRLLTENDADQDTSIFRLYMSRGTFSYVKDSSALHFQIGYDANYETSEGERITGGDADQMDISLFGSAEWTIADKLTLKPGVRLTYNSVYNAPIIPSFNARYRVGDVTLRASYARGFRAPDLKELYFEFVDINHNILGNPNLEAEYSHNTQFNAAWQHVKDQRILKLQGGLFYNHITNLITLALVPGTTEYSYTNIGRVETAGGRLGGEFSIRHFKLSAEGLVTGFRTDLSRDTEGDQFIPSWELRSNVNWKIPKLGIDFSVFYKYNGRVTNFFQGENDEILQGFTGSFNTVDLSVGRHFWKKRIHWMVGAKNLFDVTNIDAMGPTGAHSGGGGAVPMAWGRSVFTSLSFNLHP